MNEHETTTLAVWRFDGAGTAEQALPRLTGLVETGELEVHDAALVSWPDGCSKPSIRPLGALTGPGDLWGGSWGMLLGLIFLVPVAGPSFGAAAGAVAAGLEAFGVQDDFVKRVREMVTPGTSALLCLLAGGGAERVEAALPLAGVRTLRSELTPAQRRRLRDALGDESLSQT